ncbi:MAG TPA: AAA family ATPase [Candidatus Polarisedimenticolaceae bacterium]|nr:AAA family ATPase [Candidatus Polarisedimenticolaceae bacterium]
MKLLLHPAAAARVQAVTANPGGSVLLYGREGVGKRSIAREIARQLNCLGCGHQDCRACRMILGGNHPDVMAVDLDEKGKIGIERVHQLLHDLQYERYEPTGQRVVIMKQAHRLTLPAQNSLLKCLEEPPDQTTIILTCQNLQSLLPTIISRCRTVHIPRVSDNDLHEFLRSQWSDRAADFQEVIGLSQGAAGMAVTLMNDVQDLERRRQLTVEVKRLFEAGELFERLQIASAMAAGDQLEDYLAAMTSVSRQLARQGTHQGNLGAIESLRQRLTANVSPKTALEALAVELA